MTAARKPAKLRRKEAWARFMDGARAWQPEVSLTLGIVGGWTMLTLAVVSVVPDTWVRFVTFSSIGLFAWAAVGFGFIRDLAWAGLYRLSQDPKKD